MSPGSKVQTVPAQPRPATGAVAPSPLDLDFEVPGSFFYRATKRLFDIVVAATGLVLFLPLFPVIVALIRLDSKGPIVFAQKRIGKNGKLFTCYKFRSMVQDAEGMKSQLAEMNEASGPAFKIREDPRITEIGAFLRKSSLDEIPQLCNVLMGQMSVVGPRPQIPAEVELYEPWHRRRLEVKPGITCLWQIAGRSQVGFDEWMRLDLEYIRRRSLRMDFWILLQTLPAVIARKGAY